MQFNNVVLFAPIPVPTKHMPPDLRFLICPPRFYHALGHCLDFWSIRTTGQDVSWRLTYDFYALPDPGGSPAGQ